MTIKSKKGSSLILLGALLAACSGTPNPGTGTPGNNPGVGSQTVQGYLVSSTSGAAVVNSTITVDGTNVTTTTDANGRFTLRLNPGTYSLNFTKSGYAASRIEGLTVVDGQNPPLNVVQKVSFGSSIMTKAPSVKVFSTTNNGVDRGAEFTGGDIDAANPPVWQVEATAGDESLSPETVYLAVGNTPGAGMFSSREILSNDPKNTVFTATTKLSTNSINGVRGQSYLSVVVYDFNYNRLERRYPVNVTSGTANTTPLGAFTSSKAFSTTISQKRDFNTPTAAPVEESQLWVDINWNYAKGLNDAPTGFRLMRSTDGQDYRVVKTLPGTATSTRDADPALVPGQKVYYRVEAYNALGSVMSPVMTTTPLDAFKIVRMTPGNRTRDVSVKPEITWTVDKKVGDYRQFYVMVLDYPSQSASCFWGYNLCTGSTTDTMFTDKAGTANNLLKNTDNTYSVGFNATNTALAPQLEAYHSYTLDISAAAFDNDGTAISIAQDYSNIFSSLAGCNFGGPVCEGELNTFTTGNGSF